MNLNTVYNAMRKKAFQLGSGMPSNPAKPMGQVFQPKVPPVQQPKAPQQSAAQPDPTQMNPLTAMWQAFSQMANNYKQALNATTTAMKANAPQQPTVAPEPQQVPKLPV